MTEEHYSVRQIDDKFRNQTEDLKEHMNLVTAPILAQVTRTNGRVTKNEDDIMAYKVWRGWMTGGMAMLMIFVPIIIGFLTFLGLRVINFDEVVRTAIDEALEINQ